MDKSNMSSVLVRATKTAGSRVKKRLIYLAVASHNDGDLIELMEVPGVWYSSSFFEPAIPELVERRMEGDIFMKGIV